MKKLALTLALVFCVLFSFGAKKETAPASDEVIMATTDDGRRVVLLPNGTWKFVAGAPAATTPTAPTANACRDAEFDELVKYFSGWPIDKIEKDSYIIITKWMTADLPPSDIAFENLPGASITFQISMSVVVNPDCTLTVKHAFRTVNEGVGSEFSDEHMNNIIFKPLVPGKLGQWGNFYDYYRNIMLDLAAIQKKHAPNAPELAVPPPRPKTK